MFNVAFFRHASVFKTHRHPFYHCFKEVQKPFRHASVFKTRVSTRACPVLKDAAFLLAVGRFLLTVELFYLQLTILVFLLTIGVFFLQL